METTESQRTETNQVESNPNRGMSKKERRRVEALNQKLEPRIEKLEAQVQEHIANVYVDSDKRDSEGELATGKAPVALENGKEETRSPERLENDKVLENGNEEPRFPRLDGEAEAKEDPKTQERTNSPIGKLISALQAAGLGDDPTALKLVADLAALDPNRIPVAKASHLIQPSGGGIPPAPDLRTEYEKRVNELRQGDIDGLMELKREFRRRGLEVY